MKLKIDLDYKRAEPKNDEERKAYLTNSELTSYYIDFASQSKYKDGLSGVPLRTLARIQRKIDLAIEKKDKSIDLERAELDMLIEMFNADTKFPSNLSKYVVILMDTLEAVKDEKVK